MSHVGTKVRSERERKGFTQQQLADATGYSQSYIASLETGANSASLKALRKIAAALSVDPSVFVVQDNTKKDPQLVFFDQYMDHFTDQEKYFLLTQQNRPLITLVSDLVGKQGLDPDEVKELLETVIMFNKKNRG